MVRVNIDKGFKGKHPAVILLLVIQIILLSVMVEISWAGTIRGTVKLAEKDDYDKVVVYIEKAKDGFISPEENPIMDQIDLTFVPYVLPILIGTTIDFHNSDDVLNNIFTPSWAGHRFNLGTFPKGVARSFTFDRLGEVYLLCKIHPDMEGYVLVLQNPYFDVTDEQGRYQLSNVPPGNYNLKTWYNRSISSNKKIELKKGKEVVVDFR
jgi:plastocyanin